VNHIPEKAFGGEKIEIQLRKVFVGGLPHFLELEQFREYFSQFGAIDDIVILQDKRTHRPRGFGFVTFSNIIAVNSVLKMRAEH
jgi:RNA-binding protein Musashi